MRIKRLFVLLMLPVTSVLVLILHVQYKYGGSQMIAVGLRTSLAAPRTDISFTPLSWTEVNGVEKLVLFVGHAGLISAMMDAHPNIIIGYEYHVLQECMQGRHVQSKASLFNGLYESSYNSSRRGKRSKQNTEKGYDLHINTRWPGAFKQLRMIGDKDVSLLSISFGTRPIRGMSCLRLLRDEVKIPIVVFHVVQNPFDIIATNIAGSVSVQEMRPQHKKLKVNESEIMRHARALYKRAAASMEAMKVMETMFGLTLLEIRAESLSKRPREIIMKVCIVLGIPCPYGYVEACIEKISWNNPKSRHFIEWKDDVVKTIIDMMRHFPFYSSYKL